MLRFRIFFAMWVALAGIVAGCDSGEDGVAVGGGAGGGYQSPSMVTGSFSLGRFVSGGSASLESPQGSVLARTTVGPTGTFIFPKMRLPANFRVRCIPDQTTAAFFTEVQGYDGKGRSVVVNVPTSLASLYLQAHPGEQLESANQRVRRLLGLAEGTSLEYGLSESARSPFSHLAFFVDASRAGGWAALSRDLIAALDGVAVNSQAVAVKAPYVAERGDLTASLQGLETGLSAQVQPLQTYQPLVLSLVGKASKKVLGFVGEHLFSSALDVGTDSAWTTVAEHLGLNFGTTVALDHIQEQLGEVISDLVSIEATLSDADYSAAVNTLSPSIAYIQTLTEVKDAGVPGSKDGTLALAVKAADESQLPSNTPLAEPDPASPIGSLLSQVTSFVTNVDLNLIQSYQLDGSPTVNMNLLWRKNKVDNVLAVQADPRFMGFPWRSNQWLDVALQNYSYYGGMQELAGNWLAENARQSTDLGSSINSVADSLDSLAVSLKAQRAQFPQYLPSDNVLVDLQFGLMWDTTVQSPQGYNDALATADQHVVQGETQQGKVVYDDWRLPTYYELKALQDRARFYNGGYDPSVPSNSQTGYGDTGESTAGLPGLGFVGVSDAFTSSENGGKASDGGMWFASYWYNGQAWFSTYQYPLHDSQRGQFSEFEFNHENKDPNYKDDPNDKRPFLLCRSIGHPLVSPLDPKAQPGIESPTSPPEGSYPSEIEPNPIASAEYPSLGVLTSVLSPVAISLSQAATTLEFTIFLGGDFLTGNESHSESQSVPTVSSKSDLLPYSGSPNQSPKYNPLILLPWFSVTPEDSVVQVSNFPPAFEAGTGVDGFLDALNTIGSSGSIIKHTDDSGQISATLVVSGYGYDSDSDAFPVLLQANGSLTQSGAYENGKTRQPVQLQISPRNRVYDGTSTFVKGGVATENYNAALFFDNRTVDKKTSMVTWSLVDASGVEYTGDAATISAAGQLQVDLKKVPAAGLNLQVKATLNLPSGAPATATLNLASFSATKQI